MKAPNSTYSISPFGITLDNRTISSDSYRYGFQGQEVDDEIKGEGNSVNYKYRMHDPRVGRFFALDPLASEYPWNSPYAFSSNKVIAWGELEGLEHYFAADGKTYLGQVGTDKTVRKVNSAKMEKHVINAVYKQKMGIIDTYKQNYQFDIDESIANSTPYIDPATPVTSTPSDRLGGKMNVDLPSLKKATKTEFEKQFLKQEDSSKPSLDEGGKLVDDSKAQNKLPQMVIDWYDLFPEENPNEKVIVNERNSRLPPSDMPNISELDSIIDYYNVTEYSSDEKNIDSIVSKTNTKHMKDGKVVSESTERTVEKPKPKY